jgi:hypothetical protein
MLSKSVDSFEGEASEGRKRRPFNFPFVLCIYYKKRCSKNETIENEIFS